MNFRDDKAKIIIRLQKFECFAICLHFCIDMKNLIDFVICLSLSSRALHHSVHCQFLIPSSYSTPIHGNKNCKKRNRKSRNKFESSGIPIENIVFFGSKRNLISRETCGYSVKLLHTIRTSSHFRLNSKRERERERERTRRFITLPFFLFFSLFRSR